ncbi:Zinc finger protein ZFMSA12A [Merluccius polli]|uniref:Zinc finger protein ZFMSA12A n=1 Tax=Merluccius polli TaxID=89951 RepID=A0AA47NRA9_MERPO|nr:Zinc finger protein ZFMSA12A [Merluccius polli]
MPANSPRMIQEHNTITQRCHGGTKPKEAPMIPVSSVRLLVPPLRLMSAVMWDVVRLRDVRHYGKVEDFVSLVTQALPDIWTERQTRLLVLALRAKMIVMHLHAEQPEDLSSVEAHLERLRSSPGEQAPEANFEKLVQMLIEDPERRKHFLKDVFPVEFGPDFDSALEVLVCHFFTRLEERTPVPDFKQAAVWIKDATSVRVERMCEVDDLKVLLESKLCHQNSAKTDSKTALDPSEQRLLRTLSLPPSPKQTDTSTQDGLDDNHTTSEVPAEEQAPNHAAAPSSSSEGPVASGNPTGAPRVRVAHKCSQCQRCFIYRYELLEHQRLHTGENPYKCSQCGKAFRRTSDLSTHRRTQCTKAAYLCIKCGAGFKSIQERYRHKCGEKKPQKFLCPQCGKTFKRMNLMDKHQLTHGETRRFHCLQCGEACAGMRELRAHKIEVHAPEQVHQCERCGKFCGSDASLRAHELRHTEQRKQICASCGKAFKSKYALNSHMRCHTGERPFQCTYCGKRFSASGNLTIHRRIHTGEKPYLCADCGKAFVSAGELQIHRRTHTGEKPYKCVVCARAFTMASKLTLHMRVHTGERPYVCPECGKGFSRGGELKQHALKHSGVRPYACHLCAKTYMCHNHLKRHLKTHTFSYFSVPLSSLGLLVPPLRLMSAVMWEVVRTRNIKHYEKLEEFVSMVTDAVPELMTKREGRLLSLGLRARTTLELLRSEHPEDLKAVEIHLDRIRSSCMEEINDNSTDAPEANFMKLVQGLIEDSDGREHFLKTIFPVEYGPDFDTALETLVCEFFLRLEELLPVPDFKQKIAERDGSPLTNLTINQDSYTVFHTQTATWIGAEPSVLEDYMQCVSNGDDLKFLLQSKQCHGKLAKSGIGKQKNNQPKNM